MAKTPQSATPGRQLPLSRKLLFSLVVLTFVIGVPELLLRFFWTPNARPAVGSRKFVEWLSELSLGTDSGKQLYEDDSRRLWKLIPNTHVESFNPHYDPDGGERQSIRITVNSKGCRGLESSAPPAEALRVLCLGDSNFFGYPLDDGDAFPAVLERKLNQELTPRPAAVVNAGVPGYTVLQGFAWYEMAFEQQDFDWLLLSYVNNDAWPQPYTDADLLARRQAMPGWLSGLGNRLYLVQWGRSWLEGARPLEARVPLDAFERHYTQLIQAAQKKTSRVLIVDHRAYAQYEPYSEALRRLAKKHGAEYFPVAERAADALGDHEMPTRYAAQHERVRRRWGALLDERSYLRLYAEIAPEHLNEVGTAWLADQICPILLNNSK